MHGRVGGMGWGGVRVWGHVCPGGCACLEGMHGWGVHGWGWGAGRCVWPGGMHGWGVHGKGMCVCPGGVHAQGCAWLGGHA